MRQKIPSLLLVLALLCSLTAAWAAPPNGSLSIELCDWNAKTYTPATAEAVRLTLNGETLSGDVPAMIIDGRTLVPVRLVGEALSAQVLWVQQTGQVILKRGEDLIVLTLDSDSAVVNGVPASLPDGVPAQVVRYQGADRTMIPLRFVSEQLGAEVLWDQETYSAHITADTSEEPTPDPLPPEQSDKLVTDIQADANAQTVLITTDHTPEYQVMDLGDRLAVDVLGASLSSGFPGTIVVDNELISAVRYAEHGPGLRDGYDHVVRVVLDLQPGISYAKNVTVEAQENGVLLTTFLENRDDVDFTPTVPIDPEKSTIVIDPGHGGSRPGARYEGIAEKDINLAVSKKLETLLKNHGYNVVMTRSTDVDVGLYERADIANAVNADLFVSIHSNAAENRPDYQGIYTYYHPSSRRGARLAQAIQTPLCRMTGGIDRGIKDADFVVIRETQMCAVLVEMGFMTNHEELMNLIDDSYQDKLAQGISEGIVSYLNSLQS
ncbi:N-acetylmuramoyl-L-alanine amidase family protein [Intestinimonas butyriciproducens]|uniref:N-acetylmuramoyl-L-alanine amidase family protein n=2 Tax=Intestinimonas butyriciproducens TaxID=1297617 RepID=UPI0018AC3A7F|nr:N-acetylmuramoyl-L-alanine amidase family protein [Intestinimonas butyriciproducens]MDB7815640.1 N-acetylmuramoyl-L-alanine amidase family protein [Intestinimonas butyriciproducens]MDB7844705.1 N-acetylmuramoyl-L-alanine amidase family protein [Intestinimonas butyriciproducens]MDB7856662.1 N-acetylmuramoyl-L-alanine amidase family protein [Intestinimonas butyriciproducens]